MIDTSCPCSVDISVRVNSREAITGVGRKAVVLKVGLRDVFRLLPTSLYDRST